MTTETDPLPTMHFFSHEGFDGESEGVVCEECAIEHFHGWPLTEITHGRHTCTICDVTGYVGQEIEEPEYEQNHPMNGGMIK